MRLFVYGTLRPELAQGHAAELIAGLGAFVPAHLHGTLHIIEDADGCYPALVPGGAERVHGLVSADPCDPARLAPIDAFEGEDYERRELAVILADGTLARAHAWCWRGDPAGLEIIANGDFALWLKQSGKQAWRQMT